MARKIYIWGAGHWGVLTALDCEKKGIKVVGFIDSNKTLCGQKRLGIKIFSPNEFYRIKRERTYVIIATIAEQTISKILKDAGYLEGQDFESSNLVTNFNQNLILQNMLQNLQNMQNTLQNSISQNSLTLDMSRSSTKNEISILCDLYGSDKGSTFGGGNPHYKWTSHTYTTIYEYLFNSIRNDVRNVFECGLGTNNQNINNNMGADGKPGASLRVWRDYFPNADIFGADIDKEILFTENRIQTDFIDQTNPNDIKAFFAKFNKNTFDIMIDDGLHTFEAATTLLENSIEYLKDNGLYIIEDLYLQDIQRFKEYQKNNTTLNIRYWLMSTKERLDNNLIVITHTHSDDFYAIAKHLP